jgi:hypothetical protein
MKKLKCYYFYLIFVIILTTVLTVLAVLEAVALCLGWLGSKDLLWLFLSLTPLDTCLWLIAVIKKPSLAEVSKVLRTEVANKYIDKKTVEKELEQTLSTIQQCKEAADEANKNYVICKDVLAKEPD